MNNLDESLEKFKFITRIKLEYVNIQAICMKFKIISNNIEVILIVI